MFLVLNRKSEYQQWFLHIRISLANKFQLKLSILIFWTQFASKGNSSWKQEVNITIEFCIFELVYVPNFNINWQFWVFGQSLSKNGISRNVLKVPSLNIKHIFFQNSLQLLLNGTRWILIFGMKIVFTIFIKIFCNP